MAHALSKDEFHEHLRSIWADQGFPLPEDSLIGVSIVELVELSGERNEQLRLPYIDLWVTILDEHINWFISLYRVIHAEGNTTLAATHFEQSVDVLLGKVIADMMAIRHLVIAGFDTSARTVLRSLCEYLEVLVALVHQPAFSDAFVTSDTPEGAKLFWQTHLIERKLRRRVTAAWSDFFGDDNNRGAAEWLANWGRSASPVLSGLAHPSFAGGLFSLVPLKTKYADENWLGIWGNRAESSVETIFHPTAAHLPSVDAGPQLPIRYFAAAFQRSSYIR